MCKLCFFTHITRICIFVYSIAHTMEWLWCLSLFLSFYEKDQFCSFSVMPFNSIQLFQSIKNLQNETIAHMSAFLLLPNDQHMYACELMRATNRVESNTFDLTKKKTGCFPYGRFQVDFNKRLRIAVISKRNIVPMYCDLSAYVVRVRTFSFNRHMICSCMAIRLIVNNVGCWNFPPIIK